MRVKVPHNMTPNELWNVGWYRPARAVPSPNFGARPERADIDLVVVHSISLPPGQYGGDAIERLFTNCLDWSEHPYFESIRGTEVSAHFVVKRNGELVQFVSCAARAWHAGVSHYRGRSQCNDDSIGIELEGLEGDAFDPPQYDTLVDLCRALADRYPVRHIAGHEHIAPGRKIDPGIGFEWDQLQRRLAWPIGYFPT
jgi:AmpD protein